MSNLRKLTALLICVVLVVSTLVSCDVLDNLGGDKIDTSKYAAKVRIVFASNDDKISPVLDIMNSQSNIEVDGDNIYVKTVAKTNSISILNSYTLIGDSIYHLTTVDNGVQSASIREKATFTETDRFLLISEVGAGSSIDAEDFEVSDKIGEVDGVKSYNCRNISSDAKLSLEKTLAERFAMIGATVSVKGVTLSLDKKGSVVMNSVLSCDLEITLDGTVYEVTVRTYTDYSYGADVKIEAPADVADYTDVSYEDIIG